MMASRLWLAGVTLVALGLTARMVGWDTLLRIPQAALEAVRDDPGTYGVVALGVLLMVVAGLLGRRRG